MQVSRYYGEKLSAEEFQRLAAGLRTEFLADLLRVSPQMIGRYRREGAPEGRVEALRAFLQRQSAQASAR